MIGTTEATKREGKGIIYTVDDCAEEMLWDFDNGKERGSTTHIPVIDQCWTWRKGEFNIWTGYHGEGKSLFIRFLSLIKSMMDGWKFLFCAPEDFPAKEFYDDLLHTLVGITTDKNNPNQMPRGMYQYAMEMIKQRIIFIYIKPPGNTVKVTLDEFQEAIDTYDGFDVCVIDPLIKFARPKDHSERDDLYAGYITSICTDFCRSNNISLHLVMHQLTPRVLDNSGYYAKPSAYNIKGGGTWGDGTDNILTVWRPEYAKDKKSDRVIFASNKIKKQKLVGLPQEQEMKFDRRTNRYVDSVNGRDLFDFDQLFRNMPVRATR